MKNIRMSLLIFGLTGAALLAGCKGFETATPALSQNGPASLDGTTRIIPDDPSQLKPAPGAIGAFEVAYLKARQDQAEFIKSGGTLPSDEAQREAEMQRQARIAKNMLLTGYTLIENYCHQFFDDGGNNQKWLLLSQDLVASLGSLATGIVGLSNPSGNAATAAGIALGTATAYNTIDVYARNFLFGAENIQAVRKLTMDALATHRANTIPVSPDPKKEALFDMGGQYYTFGRVNDLIWQHQAICRHDKIRALVLEAIASSPTFARSPAGALFSSSGAPLTGANEALNSAAAAAKDDAMKKAKLTGETDAEAKAAGEAAAARVLSNPTGNVTIHAGAPSR